MKQIIKAFIISAVITVLLTAFTYNVPEIIDNYLHTAIFWDMPQRFFYLFVTYFLLFVFYYRQFKLSLGVTMIITVVPVILLDASVLITYPALVPFRFPLSSLFPILGAATGVFYVTKQVKKIVLLFVTYMLTSFAINTVLMPHLLYNSGNSPKAYIQNNASLLQLKLTNARHESVELADLLAQKKISLLEFYFVGCAPCVNKKASLETIQATLKNEQVGLIYICDGTVSKYDKFVADAKGNPDMYYDSTGAVLQLISPSTNSYPYEVIINAAGHIYGDFSGFDTESKTIYENETIKKLNTYLLSADSGLQPK